MPLAIMDSTWITEVRTAAASAVVARHFVGKPPQMLAMLGCGLQARRHLEAMTFPTLRTVRCHDIVRAAAERYRQEAMQRFPVNVSICDSPRADFEGADLIITCGPIAPDTPRLARADRLEPGAAAVAIDLRLLLGQRRIGARGSGAHR
jgi:ornithine cyclodeaminase/alanine dehydrogenase-like protein (mu-crystallin family)